MSPRFFTVPESFEPLEYLPSRLHKRADDARYLVDTILRRTAYGGTDNAGYVRLKAEYLNAIMAKDHAASVIEALIRSNAIVRCQYVKGEKASGYRLADRFALDRHVRVPITDRRLLRRLDEVGEHIEAKQRARWLPVHFALERSQRLLEIDSQQATEILARIPPQRNPFDVQGVIVRDIANRCFRLKVGRYGRCFNSITSMRREVRAALRFEGRPLAGIDIRNSQPAFLGSIVGRAGAGQAQGRTERMHNDSGFCLSGGTEWKAGSDVERYLAAVESGQLYDELHDAVSLDRETVKRGFLRDVLAKRGRYPSVVEDAFRRLYPSVYRFIRQVNREHHARLIRMLQRAESEFVIGILCGGLCQRCPDRLWLTIHDQVMAAESDFGTLIQSIDEAAKAHGFRFTYSIKT